MRNSVKIVLLIVLLFVLVALSFGAGFITNSVMASGQTPVLAGLGVTLDNLTGQRRSSDFKVFWEVWGIVRDEFYGQVPDDKALERGATRGALATLNDPNTTYIEPKAAAMERADLAGQFEGIGATVQTNDKGQLLIVSPFPGSPAEKAGLKPNDIVLKVDGKDVTGLGTTESVTLIRGPKGSSVVLTIQRDGGDPFDVSIVRAPIETPTVSWRLLDDHDAPTVGYMRLSLFGERSNSELERAIKDLREKGAKTLILDLRNNPGGFLNAAIDIASQFIPDGTVAYERHSDGKEDTFKAKPGGVATDIPIVLLVNGGSASASEILSGAIRDRKRGILVGVKTYGKGSVQNVHQLSDGSTLHVTVAHWLTPDKHDISQAGIEPHITVEQTPEATTQNRDLQLERALEYLRTGG